MDITEESISLLKELYEISDNKYKPVLSQVIILVSNINKGEEKDESTV